MHLIKSLFWICSVGVLSNPTAQPEPTIKNEVCGMIDVLKATAECEESLPWSVEKTAELLLNMRILTDTLHRYQMHECKGAEPMECPEAEVPKNGGLACVTVANKRYCKPLCNYGFDFAFMRRSRLYDECSAATNHKWDTQYIGGNTLAVCNKASYQVAGSDTMYFPKEEDCLTTKSNCTLRDNIFKDLTTELKERSGVEGDSQYDCLVCG